MSSQYDNLLSKAKVAFANQKYEEAKKLALNIIQFNSSQAEPYVIVGNSYLLMNNLKTAKYYYQKAIILDDKNGEYYFLLGNVYLGMEDYTKAIDCYAKAESMGCDDDIKQKIYYILGNLNQISGKNNEALINYQKAGEIKGNNDQREDILLNQLEIYVNEGDFEKAEIAARSLKMISPNKFNHYHLLFQILIQIKKLNDAEEVLNDAKSRFKSQDNQIEIIFDETLLNIYKSDLKNDNFYNEKAIELLDTLDNITQKKEIIYEKNITKSEILLRLNRANEAIQLLELIVDSEEIEYIELIERARLTIINCYLIIRNYKAMIVYSRKLKYSKNMILQHSGYYFEAYATKELAKIDISKKEEANQLYQTAIAFYRNASASDPNNVTALIYRAKSYCDIGLFDKALEIGKILPTEAQQMIDDYVMEKRGEL